MAMDIASAGFQTGLGIKQWYDGNKLEKQTVRPVYEIPEEAKKYLSLAEQMQLQGLPEEQRQQYIDNVMRNAQSGMYGLSTRGSAIGGVANIQAQTNDANKTLLAMDAQQRLGNIQNLQAARANYANYQDKAFGLNKLDPYMTNANKAAALQGAGMQNVQGGLNSFANIEASERGNMRDMISMMYSGKAQGEGGKQKFTQNANTYNVPEQDNSNLGDMEYWDMQIK